VPTPYCTPSDLTTYAASVASLSTLSSGQLTGACARASAEMDGWFAQRYALPLVSWGADVTAIACDLAVYYALKMAGWVPETPANDPYQIAYDRAHAWLDKVARRVLTPSAVPGSNAAGGMPLFFAQPRRGWGAGNPQI